MEIRPILSFLIILLFRNICAAQDPDKEILMTVAGSKVEAGEFIRMFRKSPETGDITPVDTFLKQFINFKLKVADATAEGYDTSRAYRDELNGYRKQLAQSYLTDPDIKEKLLERAYQRSQYEVKASHILISCPSSASPADTSRAFAKAMEARRRVLNGEPFEEVAKSVSDDKSVQTNGGNLGYFTVFQMIEPFENAAYGLAPGTVSMPVRTSFGYHLILVSDKRPSSGKIRVAHIMKAAPRGAPDSVVMKAKAEIDNIYKQLQSGESFSELAEKYSDDRESAKRGGELNIFGVGEIIPDFAEAAFAIKDTGRYTTPVRTIYGYHIIKLLERKPPESFQEAKPYLESRLSQSDLNSLARRSFVAMLKKEYNFRIDTPVYEWFMSNTDTLIVQGKSTYNKDELPSGNIYTFDSQNLTSAAFADYVENSMVHSRNMDPGLFIRSALEREIDERLLNYEDSRLEEKYPDFRYLMKEFHDGILLFDISSKKIWDRQIEDSTELKKFYLAHRDNFMTKKAIFAKIYTLNDPAGMSALKTAYNDYCRMQFADSLILRKFNDGNDSLLTIREGKWNEGEDPDLDGVKWEKGAHFIMKNGMPSVVVIEKTEEPVPAGYEDAKADVLAAWQDWLTAEWLRKLSKKYPVKINNQVYEEVKKWINNE